MIRENKVLVIGLYFYGASQASPPPHKIKPPAQKIIGGSHVGEILLLEECVQHCNFDFSRAIKVAVPLRFCALSGQQLVGEQFCIRHSEPFEYERLE
jgi:hypothetical protein